jgi:nitroreductase
MKSGPGNDLEPTHVEHCTRCGHCVAICPKDAIIHNELPVGDFEVLSANAITPEAMRTFLLSRRSIRAFKEKPVPDELIEQLIEVGTHAGTASNAQTEGFLIIRDRKLLADVENLVIETLWNKMKLLGNTVGRKLARIKYGSEISQQAIQYYERFKTMRAGGELENGVFRGAPALIVIHGQRSNRNVHENCAIAARNMEMLAQSIGLGTCWAGFLLVATGLTDRIASRLGIPGNRNIYSALMLGYPKRPYKKSIPRRRREVRWI